MSSWTDVRWTLIQLLAYFFHIVLCIFLVWDILLVRCNLAGTRTLNKNSKWYACKKVWESLVYTVRVIAFEIQYKADLSLNNHDSPLLKIVWYFEKTKRVFFCLEHFVLPDFFTGSNDGRTLLAPEEGFHHRIGDRTRSKTWLKVLRISVTRFKSARSLSFFQMFWYTLISSLMDCDHKSPFTEGGTRYIPKRLKKDCVRVC